MPAVAPVSAPNAFKPRPVSASELASRVNYFYAASDASSPEMATEYANCNSAGVSRRSSASFKHVATNSLVSNSPFVRQKTDGLGIRYSASQENISPGHHSRTSPFKHNQQHLLQQSPKSALATRRRVSGPRAGKFAKHSKEVKFGSDQVKEFDTEEDTEASVYSAHETVPLRKLPSPFETQSKLSTTPSASSSTATLVPAVVREVKSAAPEPPQDMDVLVRDILADCPLSPPTHTSLPAHKKSPNWRLSAGGTTLVDADVGPFTAPHGATSAATKQSDQSYILPEVKSVSVFSPTPTNNASDSDENTQHNSFSTIPERKIEAVQPRSLPQVPATKVQSEPKIESQPFVLPPIDDFGKTSFMPTPELNQSGPSSPIIDNPVQSLVGRQRVNRATVLARVKAELGEVPSHVPSSESFSTSTLFGAPGMASTDMFSFKRAASAITKKEVPDFNLPSPMEEPILPKLQQISLAEGPIHTDIKTSPIKSKIAAVRQPSQPRGGSTSPTKLASPSKKSYFIDDGISSEEDEEENEEIQSDEDTPLSLPAGGAQQRADAIIAARRKLRNDSQPVARRRSLSVGAEEESAPKTEVRGITTSTQATTAAQTSPEGEDFGLELGKEMGRIMGDNGKVSPSTVLLEEMLILHKKTYTLIEREEIKVSSPSLDSKIVNNSAGDVDQGRAWKTVRRPSDMNEYAAHMKELRAKDKSPNAAGKVFVKVIGIQGLELPLPDRPTFFCCTLDNTIQCVATPYGALERDSKIMQEFDLIMNKSLQFTLDLKVRMDSHLRRSNAQASPVPSSILSSRPITPIETKSGSTTGFRAFFGSPKKKKEREMHSPASPAPQQHVQPMTPVEPLLRYLSKEGSFGRARVVFSDISDMCQGKSVRLEIPLVGQKISSTSPLPLPCVVGKILVQVFCLPSLMGVRQSALPSCLEDAEKAIRHGEWHRKRIIAGTLTQNGGDCSTWKRRTLEIVGGRIIAYNDITKKPIATIDLSKAKSVIDDQAPGAAAQDEDECEIYLERSFRVVFGTSKEGEYEEIAFFADTDDDKAMWLKALNALVGRIPEKHLWVQALFASQTQSKIPVRADPVSTSARTTRLPSRSKLEERPPPPAASSGTAMCSSAELARRKR